MGSAEKVSICVPIYNTGKYLARCIESLISQSYQNLEIILTDDGSTDESGAICDKYANLDSRVVVIHQLNGGEASARNAGLSAATGEYVMFCDSDDEYLPDAVQLMTDAMREQNADLVMGGYLERTEEVERFAIGHLRRYSPQTLAREQLNSQCPYGIRYISSTVNGKLFRRKILSENHIRFDKRFVIGNDTVLMCEYLKYVNLIYDVFTPIYVYYKFDPEERQQGMSYYYPDSIFHSTYVAGKMIELAQLDKTEREQTVAKYYRAFVAGCIYAAFNTHYLSEKELSPYLVALSSVENLVQEGAGLCRKGVCAARGVEIVAFQLISGFLLHHRYREVERIVRLLARIKGIKPYQGGRARLMIQLRTEDK